MAFRILLPLITKRLMMIPAPVIKTLWHVSDRLSFDDAATFKAHPVLAIAILALSLLM